MSDTKTQNHRTNHVSRRRALTSDEAHRMRDGTTQSPPEIRLAILLALHAGLRLSEVCGLNIDNISTSGIINSAVEITAENAKYARARTVPLDQTLRQSISEYIRLTRPKQIDDSSVSALLICKHTKQRITPRTIQRQYKSIAAQLAIRGTTFHSLRHTFAERLRRVTDLPTLQMLLGHRHLSSTQVYMHPGADDAAQAINDAWRRV